MSSPAETSASFDFDFHPLFRAAAMPFGVNPGNAGVEVTATEFRVRFGRWSLRTLLANVVSAEVTGPYAWPKVIGPPHLSLSDRGVTFATNAEEGVCVRFERPVRAIDPLGLIRHPGVTVTVEAAATLAELLDRERHDTDRVHADPDRPRLVDLVEATHDDLQSMTAAQLRERAAERGITGTSRRSKKELIALLEPEVDEPEGL